MVRLKWTRPSSVGRPHQWPPFCTICEKRLVIIKVVSMKRSTQFCRHVSVR